TDVGETWLLDVHELRDGKAIVGARGDSLPGDIRSRLEANGRRFGNTLREAMDVQERSIDEMVDFAVFDSQGNLRRSMSGIPLQTDKPNIPAALEFVPRKEANSRLYALIKFPIKNTDGSTAGLITTFQDITDQEKVLHEAATFNSAVTAIVWLLAISLVA